MKTKTIRFLEVNYTHPTGNKSVFYARSISVNMDNVTFVGRDDTSESITIPLCDMHEIKTAVVHLEA